MTTALSVARQKLSEVIGDWRPGTTTATGSNVTAVDSLLAEFPDDYFIDWYIYLTSGTYAASKRPVSDFTSTGGTVTWTAILAGNSGSSITYELHRIDPTYFMQALNNAMLETYPYLYKEIADETVTASSLRTYSIPTALAAATIINIYKRTVEGTTSTLDEWEEMYNFRVENQTGGKKIYFIDTIPGTELLRIIGHQPLTAFTTDASTTEIDNKNLMPLIMYAAYLLSRSLKGILSAEDTGRLRLDADEYLSKYHELKRQQGMPMPNVRIPYTFKC